MNTLEQIVEFLKRIHGEYSEVIDYIQNLFGDNEFFQATMVTGLIMGVATFVWRYAYSIPVNIWNRYILRRIKFHLTVEESRDNIYYVFEKHMQSLAGKETKRNITLTARNGNTLEMENLKDEMWYWYKYKWFYWPIIIEKDRRELSAAKDKDTLHQEFYKITSWFNRAVLVDMYKDVKKQYSAFMQDADEKAVYSAEGRYGGTEIIKLKRCKSIDNIFFKGKKELIEDIDKFIENEEFYNKKGITYKRNYLLQGPPGTGKTVTCQAISKHLNRNMYVLNISKSMGDYGLLDTITSLPEYTVLVFEDLDRIFGPDKQLIPGIDITLKALLNIFNGVYTRHGLITLITCNEPENLPEVLKRDGRVDRIQNVPPASYREIKHYISNFFEREIGKNVKITKILPMSTVEKLCMKHLHSMEDAIKAINKYEMDNRTD